MIHGMPRLITRESADATKGIRRDDMRTAYRATVAAAREVQDELSHWLPCRSHMQHDAP